MKRWQLWAGWMLVWTGLVSAQSIDLPSDPLAGRIVFENKGCIECHAVNGYGGDLAPDLARSRYYGSLLELGSVIWNHIPNMNRTFRKLGKVRPTFSEGEMLNLIGFLYYLRYLGEPGSVSRGRELLDSKRCLTCHRVGSIGGKIGPDFAKIKEYASPLFIVQAMWNHGPAMQKQMNRLNVGYPLLTGKDIVDISAYLREASHAAKEIYMSPGDPQKGQSLFREKHCINCHQQDGNDRNIAPNLAGLDLKKSVTEIAGLMWNHSPKMMRYMSQQKIDWPKFNGTEMADIISYLYFLGFQDAPGNTAIGEQVFDEKGCGRCHESGGGGVGPDLTSLEKMDSPVQMLKLMWNHAPKMEDMLLMQNEEWPVLTREELQNLFAYLQNEAETKKE